MHVVSNGTVIAGSAHTAVVEGSDYTWAKAIEFCADGRPGPEGR